MKNFTLALVMLLLAFAGTTVYAQEDVDITPAKLKFATSDVGPFVYDQVCERNEESNAPNNFPAAKSDDGGFAYLFSWGNVWVDTDGNDKGATTYVRQMSNIVDLGGEVGKVWCMKGHDCSDDVFPYGIKPTTEPIWVGWLHQAFYFGSKINGAAYKSQKYTGRLSITWRVCLPEGEYSDKNGIFDAAVRDYSGNEKLQVGSQEKAILKTLQSDTEDADTWCKQEIDFEFNGDDQQVPLYIKFSHGRNDVEKFALLIKEMKITINPTTPIEKWNAFTLTMNPPTSVKDELAFACNYTIEGDNVVIDNLKGEQVSLYNTLGATITSFKATQSTENISLKENGMFILKVGEKSFKIVK